MAVYTKINKESISYINKLFDIEKFISFQGIKKHLLMLMDFYKKKTQKMILLLTGQT